MPSANIHPDACIGKNVRIAPFATVCEDVVIGDNCEIGPNAVIMPGTTIGSGCQIFSGAVIGAIPQDLKFNNEKTTVEIGDNTIIREYVTINRGTADKNKTVVGSNVLLMAYVHVAHDCTVGNHVILANCVNLAGHIVIDEWSILEGLVAVQQFIRIGRHSFISGGSLVRKNVPPYVKAAREPLSYIGVNSIGLRRRGVDNEKIREIEDFYRTLYIRNNTISSGLKALLELDSKSPEKEEIIRFIKSSDNGVMNG